MVPAFGVCSSAVQEVILPGCPQVVPPLITRRSAPVDVLGTDVSGTEALLEVAEHVCVNAKLLHAAVAFDDVWEMYLGVLYMAFC